MAKQTKQTTHQKSKKGPHGGNTPYQQTKMAKGFIAIDTRPGHSQKKNIKDK